MIAPIWYLFFPFQATSILLLYLFSVSPHSSGRQLAGLCLRVSKEGLGLGPGTPSLGLVLLATASQLPPTWGSLIEGRGPPSSGFSKNKMSTQQRIV
jgi:hypothetical protein